MLVEQVHHLGKTMVEFCFMCWLRPGKRSSLAGVWGRVVERLMSIQPDDPALSWDTCDLSEKIFENALLKLGKVVLWFCIFILIVLRQMTTHWPGSKRFSSLSLSLFTNKFRVKHYLAISRAVPALCLKVGVFNCPNSPGSQSWYLSAMGQMAEWLSVKGRWRYSDPFCCSV